MPNKTKYPKPPQAKVDMVNHPPHYLQNPSGVECIEIVRHLNFNRGSAIKYIWRADEKGKTIEDLKKARFYLDDEITKLEAEQVPVIVVRKP